MVNRNCRAVAIFGNIIQCQTLGMTRLIGREETFEAFRSTVGFSARTDDQEISKKIFPEAVRTGRDGYKSVNYSALVAPLAQAVKELSGRGRELESRLEKLEKQGAGANR